MLPASEVRARVEFSYSLELHSSNPKDYWDRVAKVWAAADERFIGKYPHIRDVAMEVTSDGDPPETKLRKLYARAQQLHNLNEEPEKTAQEEKRDKSKANLNVDDVLKHGYGSTVNIDRFFVALAQAVGFDSGLTWVAQRSKNLLHSEEQDSSQLSGPVVWVRAGDKDYYLSPGAELCPFGTLPWDETEASGMRPTNAGAIFFQTPRQPSSSSVTERIAQLTLNSDGTITGTFTVRFTGQRSLMRRAEVLEEDETGRNKMITDEINGWLPSSAKFDLTSITGWDKTDAPLEAKGKLRIPEITQIAGHRILIPVGLYEAGQRQIFESATRKQDVYFPYPYEEVDDITLQLPSGWSVDSLPVAKMLNPGGLLNFVISARPEGESLHIQRHMIVGSVFYRASVYSELRNFSQAKANDEQQIVLQAAASASN